MAVSQSTNYCATCDQQRLFVKTKPNHLLHLFLSVITLGVWLLFVWIPLTVIAALKEPNCSSCGMKPSVSAREAIAEDRRLARLEAAELES